jgi:uncharacterized protein YerC
MGSKIPHAIRLQVLSRLVSGQSHDDISFCTGVCAGTVSNILRECRKGEITDIDLLRSVAVEMKKQGIGLNALAFSIRLRNMLNTLELPEEKVEKFLQALSIYNYKHDIEDPSIIISEILKVSDYVARLEISVFDIVDYVEKMITELNKLNSEIRVAKLDLAGLQYKIGKETIEHIKSKDSRNT